MKRVVAGKRAALEALRSQGEVSVVYLREAEQERELVEACTRRGVEWAERSEAELDALAKGVRHQGVVAICGEYPYVDLEAVLEHAQTPGLIVALDELTDPHNFGAIVRSAVAFGCDGLITLKHRAAPVTPVVVRASAGATEHACIARVANLTRALETLRERGYSAVGLDAEGEHTVDALPEAPGGRVLVVGSEGRGLRRLVRENCDVLARIPMDGRIASLNASVAAGIAIHEASRARREGR